MIGTNQKLLMARAGKQPVETAWNLAAAQFDGGPIPFFTVAAQESVPTGVCFSTDGAYMYVVGSANDFVRQYVLSTAWDVGTASYLQGFFVRVQEGTPTGLFFKPDGTEMYIVGSSNDVVVQYGLSTAWDVTTATFTRSLSIGAQELTPTGVFFKPDGTKMYVIGSSGDDVNEYNLSTAWNISSASFVQAQLVSAQTTTPQDVFFKPDGTKMYVCGTNAIFEYALSSAWNVSTATYTTVISVASVSIGTNGVFFKSDGTKMYIVDSTTDRVYAFDVSTAWDVSTATYNLPDDYFTATSIANPEAVYLRPDGTSMYVLGETNDRVYQFSLSPAWDITNASPTTNFSISGQDTFAQGLFFKSDGTKMYVLGNSTDTVYEYSLATAWDVSSASLLGSFSIASEQASPTGVFFRADGTQMYIVGTSTAKVSKFTLSTAWQVSSASFSQSFSLSSETTSPQGVFIRPDGTRMFVIAADDDAVLAFNLGTAWDLSTATYSRSFSVAAQDTFPTGLFFKDDGLKMYITGIQIDAVWMFNFE